ncbi:MYB-like transcription factor ETC3 [Typha latifolia]|uniref:MYB-like transcription factor ETC3 n=1 Tax=Typha latifolia TaxID=4733 RepID=UPI003C2ECCFC
MAAAVCLPVLLGVAENLPFIYHLSINVRYPTPQRLSLFSHWFLLERLLLPVAMDKRQQRKQSRTVDDNFQVGRIEWQIVNMSEQEEDLVYRMHKLVGERWELIAGRIPGRRPEEIERFWIMRGGKGLTRDRREKREAA